MARSPSHELAEAGRAEAVSRFQGRHLFDEEDATRPEPRVAVVRQRAEGRVVAEETEDQGVALREGRIDRRAAVERAGMEHDHISGLRRPRSNVVHVGIQLPLSLDIGKARQSAASMEGLGRIVRIEEGSSVVTSSPVRAWNDLQRILLGDCFEADPRIAQMFAAPGQIRGVLMPGVREPRPPVLRNTSSAKYQTCLEPQRSANSWPKGRKATSSSSRAFASGLALSLCDCCSVPSNMRKALGPWFSTAQSKAARPRASCSSLRTPLTRTAPSSRNACRVASCMGCSLLCRCK